MALLLDEPRHANVVAVGPVEVLVLEKDNFIRLLGPVRDVLSRQMRIRVLKSVPLLSKLSDQELDDVGAWLGLHGPPPHKAHAPPLPPSRLCAWRGRWGTR
jgi:CRP-like cAMP-binding protein